MTLLLSGRASALQLAEEPVARGGKVLVVQEADVGAKMEDFITNFPKALQFDGYEFAVVPQQSLEDRPIGRTNDDRAVILKTHLLQFCRNGPFSGLIALRKCTIN